MIEIIEAGINDFDTVHALARQVWPQTYGAILSAKQIDYMFSMMYSREAYIEQLTIKNHRFLLAKQDDIFRGFASYQPGYETGITKIHKLYILPGLQGKGMGKLFVNTIYEIAKRNADKAIQLNVNRYNPAVHFYEATGFKKVREEDIDIGQGYLMEDYVMQKEIA